LRGDGAMSDFLQMYRRQKLFLTEILNMREYRHEHVALTKEYLLRLQVELSEVYNAAKLKEHVPVLNSTEKEHLLEELVDGFKFLLNILLVNGFTGEDVIRKFHEKSTNVEKRAKEEKWHEMRYPNPT